MRPEYKMLNRRLDRLKVASVAETLRGYDTSAWFGLCAPAGTARDIIVKLAKASTDAIADPEIREKLVGIGLKPYVTPSGIFSAHIVDRYATYAKVVDEASIKA